jgi:selenocysteine-specific elongation factor
VRRFVVGTAGHVDHGKTTLVHALTGVDTDRLPEEKRRGITIELGFAPWDLGGGVQVSVIDVPGHRRLVHAMIAGAIGMEVVLLVVAADEGVMPQTREHIAACTILGIRRAVVAVTKVDRVGEELAQLAGEEARELLGARFEADVVTCSARTGKGLDAVRDAVRRALLSLPAPEPSARARLSVDRVFSVRGAGTVVTGTLVEGRVATGKPIFVVGKGGAQSTLIRGLHVHDHQVTAAEAPTRLAINLASLPVESVNRGDVVTDDASIVPTGLVDVVLGDGAQLKHGSVASLYVGTARMTARIDPVRGRDTVASPSLFVRLRLGRPLVAVGGDRFVLRGSDVDGSAGAVIGGGVVLDARPPRARARAKRRTVLEALAAKDAAAAVRALVAEASPRPFPRAALASRFVLRASALASAADALADRRELVRLKSVGWMERGTLSGLSATARRLVAEHHRHAPHDRGLVRETLRQRLAEIAGLDAAEEAIRVAADARAEGVPGEPIVVEGDIARVVGFGTGTLAQGASGIVAIAAEALARAALKGLGEFAVGEATKAPPKEVRAILAKLVREGVAVHAGELWFARASVDDLRARVVEHLSRAPRLTIAEFKEMSGLGRKPAIVLLELFDREGVTRRDGDDRVPGAPLRVPCAADPRRSTE